MLLFTDFTVTGTEAIVFNMVYIHITYELQYIVNARATCLLIAALSYLFIYFIKKQYITAEEAYRTARDIETVGHRDQSGSRPLAI